MAVNGYINGAAGNAAEYRFGFPVTATAGVNAAIGTNVDAVSIDGRKLCEV
ncbi:hypothetical protein [Idiomarina tyrosinivorans]|uniref:hypothetical protein n=1 Tax=Idiomarina tyrosinivorans TaxID=1445662 RepID=UPI001300A69D|nr:hypothetical protein [Idiomarina tyrosinivorans]